MSISSIGVSYSQLQQTSSSTLSIKGQSSSDTKSGGTSVSSAGSMDTVSLSAEASQSYKIGGESVTKAEFDKYDADGDGEISSSEQAAYEADQADAADEDDTTAKLLESMQEAEKQDEEDASTSYSPYGSMSIRGESGSNINATA